jgi:Zn-dependent peptidase ImmA (M78 family)/DNA-binding XRE family transcriptional regulator
MNQTVNPEMVRLAREARGLNQTGLAHRAGLSQATISKIEAGVTEATSDALTKIARASDRPEAFFYQTDPVYGPSTSEFFHRKRQRVPATVLAKIHAQINIQRIQIARLLRAIELPDCRIPALDIADFHGNPNEIARAVRAMLNLPPGPISNVVRVIEDAGGLIVPCAFGSYDVDAISRWVPGMPPMFFANRNAPVDRFRMSLAHELGHMVMHRAPEAEMEDQANEFAAEFLMPQREIRSDLYGVTLAKLGALKPYWRVSMGALLKRASDLGTIQSEASRYLWMHFSKRGYRKREPAELDLSPERPTLLGEMIEFYRQDLGYSVDELARALVAPIREITELYGIETSRPETQRRLRRVK